MNIPRKQFIGATSTKGLLMLKKPKDKKKPSLKNLKKKLDHVFELYIRHRDFFRCFTCGITYPNNTTDMHAGHLISRKQHATRWDEENVFAQCARCNFRHVWQPHIYTDMYVQRFGADQYHKIVEKSHEIFKVNKGSLEPLIEKYENKLNEAKNRN
jgi:5-methylcytosine-specific restriction endonuclease McrA